MDFIYSTQSIYRYCILRHNVYIYACMYILYTYILSFLRLNTSTAFQTLLLIKKATPFLLWDSHPQ